MSRRTKKNKQIRVLVASPEVMPFAGTGGLGEVAGSMPRAVNALAEANVECRVIMPLYESVKEEYREKMEFLGHREIPVAWRSQYMGIYALERDGVIYYFVDNEYYFKRPRIYGFGDDCERFTFFSRAVIESSDITGFEPDIIHANDWQTAPAVVLARTLCRQKDLRTLFTIHNVEYQGVYGREMLGDCLGLDEEEGSALIKDGGINLMKGAVELSDLFNTVSPTYARELTYPVSAFGMDEVIRNNAHKLTGILNGIDTISYDPAGDPFTEAGFSSTDIKGKKACKRALQRSLELEESDVPMLTMISRLVPPKGVDLIVDIMDGLLETRDMQFVLLGTGEEKYEEYFRELQHRHTGKVRSLIEFNTATAHRIYAGGDMLLMPSRSEACGLAQMIACRYGNVPIVRLTGGLADSISEWDGCKGNGFTFFDFVGQELRGAIDRAMELYEDKEAWETLVRHILDEDFTWERSAREYCKLYKGLI